MFQFDYILREAGWATASIGNGSASKEFRISYMMDPLVQIAQVACYFLENENRLHHDLGLTINFKDDPGAHLLELSDPCMKQHHGPNCDNMLPHVTKE